MSKRTPSFSLSLKSAVLVLATVIAAVPLTGCDLTRNTLTSTERSLDYNREDMRQALAPRPLEDDGNADAPIPAFEPYVGDPALDTKPTPLVTISVNQTIPLREILFELAEQAEVDMELDPNIRGSIIFTARQRPFDEVMEHITSLAGLRYSVKNGIYRIEVDTPYNKTYKVDYLGLTRNAQSNIAYNVSLGGSGGGGGGGGGGGSGGSTQTSSSATVSADYEANLWSEVEDNINKILKSGTAYRSLRSKKDPRTTTSVPTPAPLPTAGSVGPGPGTVPTAGQQAAAVQPQAGEENQPVDLQTQANQANTLGQQPQPVQAANPTAAPSLTVQTAPPLAEGDEEEDEPFTPEVGINRMAGTITVFATDRLHKEVDTYLVQLRKKVTSQVLIEARVLEVALTDEYAAGIDWGTFNLISGNLSATGSFPIAALNPALTGGESFNLSYNSNDLDLAIDAISRFGTVHSVSSPRLTVLNNQMAVLNVAENVVFFDIEIDQQQPTVVNGVIVQGSTDIETEALTVPEGLIMTVTPSVDLETSDIMLALRPTLTRIGSTVVDPTIPLAFAFSGQNPANFGNPTNLIPQISVQEMDSVVRIHSGTVLVMGGLMSDRTTAEEIGVPVLSDIPLVGAAFRSHSDKITKTELVIFLKATVVPSQYTHETDRQLYQDFSQDRRPLKM